MSDVYTPYETGLRALLERLGHDHPRYSDALVYQQRLTENIKAARRYGDTESRRAERAEITDRLNGLAQEALGISYNAICQSSQGAAVSDLDLDSPEAEAARERYLEALRQRYNVIETHAYVALAQDDQVGNPQRLDLLGEKGVYVPLRFDPPAGRRRGRAEAPTDWPKGGGKEEMAELVEREMRP